MHSCTICSGPVPRKAGESETTWRRRLCCSDACTSAARARGAAARSDEPKTCVVCGCTFHRREGESSMNYSSRATCRHECAVVRRGQSISARVTPRTVLRQCPGCARIIPKPREMTWAHYRAKRTCGAEACRVAVAAQAGSRAHRTGREMSNAEAKAALAASQRQVRAYLAATEAERRLFDPDIAAAALRGAASARDGVGRGHRPAEAARGL